MKKSNIEVIKKVLIMVFLQEEKLSYTGIIILANAVARRTLDWKSIISSLGVKVAQTMKTI